MVCLEDVQGARRASVGQRVDEYECPPVLEQVVCQVQATDAVVDGVDVVVSLSSEDVTQHLGSEAVVTEEDVADAG